MYKNKNACGETPTDDIRLEVVKTHSLLRRHHHLHGDDDEIDYIDKKTNGIIASKLYEEQAKKEEAIRQKAHDKQKEYEI